MKHPISLRLVPRRLGTVRSSCVALAIGCVGVAFWSCGDSGPSEPSIRPVASVAVSPAGDTLTSVGLTTSFTATATDADGNTIPGKDFIWSSTNIGVATIDSAGVATAVGNGQTTIRAVADGVGGTASLAVSQVVASIEVIASRDTLTALLDTLHLTAIARDARGHTVANSTFAWATSDSAVANVSERGVVTALAPGSVTISASTQGALGSMVVTIKQRSATMIVTPDTTTLTALMDTVRLLAETRDANDQPLSVQPAVTWGSSADTVATVEGTGLVTAVGNGSATIAATADGVSGTATVLVKQVVATVEVVVTMDTLTALGDTVRCTATAKDAQGQVVAAASFEWSSSDTSVVSVGVDGLVTANGNGSAMIMATVDGVSDSEMVVVAQVATLLRLTPDSVQVAIGDTVRLHSLFEDANGFPMQGESLTWRSASDAVATVDDIGLVTGVAAGVTTVTGTSGDLVGSATVVVSSTIPAHLQLVAPGQVPHDSSFAVELQLDMMGITAASGAVAVEIGWDPSALELGDWSGFQGVFAWTAVHWVKSGLLRVAVFSTSGLPTQTTLLSIPYRAIGPSSTTPALSLAVVQVIAFSTFDDISNALEARGTSVTIN